MPDENPNHRDVAALLALDIDIAWDIARQHEKDASVLFGQLRLLKRSRDRAVSGDPKDIEATRKRFATVQMLFHLPHAPAGSERDGG